MKIETKPDASPYIHAEPVNREIEHAAHELICHRLSKEEYDEQQRLKRDPRFKKTGKES